MRRARRRVHKKSQRGFVLLFVMIILILLVMVFMIALDESAEELQTIGRSRYQELVSSATDHGLSTALNQVATMDSTAVNQLGSTSDIFSNWNGAQSFVPDEAWPPAGEPYAQELNLRVGATAGQRTRAPAGEDVRSSYGTIVNIQISVRMDTPGVGTASEQRVEVGVVVPQTYSHSN